MTPKENHEQAPLATSNSVPKTTMSMSTYLSATKEQQEAIAAVKDKFKMVALDLDGTLLSNNHQLSTEQAAYLRHLHDNGITICFATGRSIPSVYEHITTLNLPVPLPVVCSNGSRGLHCKPNNVIVEDLFSDPVPLDIVQRAIAVSNRHGYCVQLYYENSIYANQKTESHYNLTGQYTSLTGSAIQHVDDDFQRFLHSDHKLPSKILILFDEQQCSTAFDVYKREYDNGDATIVGGSFDWFLEILNSDVTKGHGLQKMCRRLDVPIEKCIAFGDGANDQEFLQMAGLGIVMKNAKESIQQYGDVVTEYTNHELGVMKTLQQLEQANLLDLSSSA